MSAVILHVKKAMHSSYNILLVGLPIVCVIVVSLVVNVFSKSLTQTSIESFILSELRWIEHALETNQTTLIQLKLVGEPFLAGIAVWDQSNTLIYPDTSTPPRLYETRTLHHLGRLNTLANSTQQNVWEAHDAANHYLHFCFETSNSICLILKTKELAEAMSISIPMLLNSVLTDNSAPSTRFMNIAFTVLLITVIALLSWQRVEKCRFRANEVSHHIFTMGDMEVDPLKMRITRDKLTANITHRDLKLLKCLYQRPDEVVSKDILYDAGWSRRFVPNSRCLEQHISTLRNKIDPERNRIPIIATVHGQGYRFPNQQN